MDGLTVKREDGVLPPLDGGLKRVLLVGAGEERYMAELARLAETLGLDVVGVVEQNRRDNAGYIGRGKRIELAEEVKLKGAGMVVTDDELTASQSRVLERDCEAPVIDRTELIIRIFHEHARDAPSKLQVELAELSYLLPRVRGMWRHLERLGGGSAGSAGSSGSSASGGRATRGPGEQQLEYDRRQIRTRMERLKKRLREEGSSREVQRSRLKANDIPKVALVGYTNAGKTTVLNALSGAGRQTRDRLFETLETTTRQVGATGEEAHERQNGSGAEGGYRPSFTVTDTVGFIRKLPTQLVESFSSTLEAAAGADILILCADVSSPYLEREVRIVRETLLEDPENHDKPIILLLNKGDLVSGNGVRSFEVGYPGAVIADFGSGYGALLERVYREISGMRKRLTLLIPHADYSEVAGLYGGATIHDRKETEDGVLMDVSISKERISSYLRYEVGSTERSNPG